MLLCEMFLSIMRFYCDLPEDPKWHCCSRYGYSARCLFFLAALFSYCGQHLTEMQSSKRPELFEKLLNRKSFGQCQTTGIRKARIWPFSPIRTDTFSSELTKPIRPERCNHPVCSNIMSILTRFGNEIASLGSVSRCSWPKNAK